jgi:hypothetical protein
LGSGTLNRGEAWGAGALLRSEHAEELAEARRLRDAELARLERAEKAEETRTCKESASWLREHGQGLRDVQYSYDQISIEQFKTGAKGILETKPPKEIRERVEAVSAALNEAAATCCRVGAVGDSLSKRRLAAAVDRLASVGMACGIEL